MRSRDSFNNNNNHQDQYVTAVTASHTLKTLLDSGALEENFISSDIVKKLKLQTFNIHVPIYVMSVHGKECINKYVILSMNLTYKGERISLPPLKFLILDKGPAPITIGLPDIRRHDITNKLRAFFAPSMRMEEQKESPGQRLDVSQAPLLQAHQIRTASKEMFLDPVAMTDPIDDMPEDIWTKYFQDSQDTAAPSPTDKEEIAWTFDVHGTEESKKLLLEFLEKNRDVFATEVKNIPANLPAFHIDIDKEAWLKDRRSREYTRPQSLERVVAIRKFIRQAIADNVITWSEAPGWSQILLTKKPNGKWRFCLDYRTLNKYTKNRGWPIPNISQVLEHIGTHKPKLFAVMDLTSGFYQCPLSVDSQDYTTFTSCEGNFKWLRPPMGLRNVPPYFQQMMTQTVFPSLLHKIIEIYLDDLLTWSQDIDELINNLNKIFTLLRKHGMVLNPEKCHFGMSEVEYVGHLINEKGLLFSKDKLQTVADFVRPTNKGELKSFVGLGSYFRNHIPNYSTLVHPLNEMLEGYTKKDRKKPLTWSEQYSSCFEAVKTAIFNCQQLFFRDQSAAIRLYTDASDYGIGAYLCQVVEGPEQPIGFISKTLTRAEKRWSVYEKEAYAIFYALRKWEHHLRDNKFTLYTDHRNLTFLNKDPSPKVQRWKIAVQEYSFDIAYIEGENNNIADCFSRFCPRQLTDDAEDNLKSAYSLNSLAACYTDDELTSLHSLICKETERKQYYVSKEQYINFNILMLELNNFKKLPHLPEHIHRIISQCHNSNVGHFGVNTTLSMVEKYLNENSDKMKELEWLTKREDISTYIKKCPCCQKMRQARLEVHTDKYTTSKYGIFENISIDAIYMPISNDGYKYILTIVDSFTRYIEIYSIKDLTARAAVDCIMHYMSTYGVPNNICTDNSSQFQGIYEEVLKLLQIHNYKIHPYSHQENSIVERANKEIQRHLRNIVFDSKIKNDWPTVLPLVKRILNAKVHASTGVAPADLVFAGQVDLNAGILFDKKSTQSDIKISEYMKRLYEYQDIVLKKAYETQEETDLLRIAKADPVNKTEFPVQSYVLVQPEQGPVDKLSPRLRGPYLVLHKRMRKEGDVYTCQHLSTNKIEDFHVKLLTSFNYDDTRINPLEVATHDDEYHIVQAVLEHKFKNNGNKTRDLILKIKWLSEDSPEWVSYDTLKKVEIVHDYLYKNRLATHVPNAFKRVNETLPVIEETRKRVYFEESDDFPNNSSQKHDYQTRYKRGKTTKLLSYK